jgi:hypothetical protein
VSTNEVAEVVAASSLAELCWVDEQGVPQARGVVALVRDLRPTLAFTYADEPVAREVARAPQVSLVLAESRSTGAPFRPMLLSGRPRLTEDPSGDVYVSELAIQELRRYPPARLLADSPLLMREHWWYLPRLVVDLDVESVRPVPRRAPSHDHVLVVADGAAPVVRPAAPVVRPAAPGEQANARLPLTVEGPSPGPGPAVLFGQDASFPDLERWSQWRYRGRWDGSALVVEEAPARTGLAPVPGLMQRWRRQRALERGCVAAIPRVGP